jgi:hypothetical protein
MNARPELPLRWLQPGTTYDVCEQPGDHFGRVAGFALDVPEQGRVRILRCADLTPCSDVGPEFGHHTVRKWQNSGLEELGLPNRDGAVTGINVTKIQPGQLSPPQTRTVGQQQHGVDAQRTKCCPRRGIRAGNVEHSPYVDRRVDIRPSPLLADLLLGSRIRSTPRN